MKKNTRKINNRIMLGFISLVLSCNWGFASEKPSKGSLPDAEASAKFIERITQKNNCLGLISLDEKTLRERFCDLYNKEEKEKLINNR